MQACVLDRRGGACREGLQDPDVALAEGVLLRALQVQDADDPASGLEWDRQLGAGSLGVGEIAWVLRDVPHVQGLAAHGRGHRDPGSIEVERPRRGHRGVGAGELHERTAVVDDE